MSKTKIISTGSALGSKEINNLYFEKKLDTSDEWIKSRTGIHKRNFISKDENNKTLALRAAKRTLENQDLSKIKYVVVATFTPDNFSPSVACTILEELNLNSRVMAFDINAACSGFVYALNVASCMLKENEQALVIGVDCVSKLLDFKDRSTCVLFGDGAGAVLIEYDKNYEMNFYCKSKTDEKKILYSTSIDKVNQTQKFEFNDYYLHMIGSEVFRFAIEKVTESIVEILKENKVSIEQIDLIIPHQANYRIIESIAKKLNINSDKFYLNLDKYGNTSAASIPIALDEAFKNKIIKKGNKILLVGFGSGLAWGSSIINF